MVRNSPEPIRIQLSYARSPWYIRHWRWWFYGLGFPLAVIAYVLVINPHS